MASNYDIAKMIPAQYRKVILEKNHVYKAVVQFNDWEMMQLWYYWAMFIEPDNPQYGFTFDMITKTIVPHNQCGRCLQKLMDKWLKIIEPLIELEKEALMLELLP